MPSPTSPPTVTPVPDTPTPALPPTATSTPTVAEELGIFNFSTRDWKTDFYKSTINLEEIFRGQIKDGIPAISEPKFESQEDAALWIGDVVPVLAVEVNGEAKAYPLGMLIWHEIVNDELGGVPVAATYCPLCNTGLAFSREVDGRVLEFGVSGLLRNSDLIMFDRETESFWQQATGNGIVGEFAGTRLEFLPAAIVSFADFREAFPDALVLSRDSGFHSRYSDVYGRNPYFRYDTKMTTPFLFFGERDRRLDLMERVAAVEINGAAKAYPFELISEAQVVADEVGGQPLVVFWKSGTASALDENDMAESEDIGATGVFDPVIEGRTLTFEAQGDVFIDAQTGSAWNIFGKAVAGPMEGKSLARIVHSDHFWFAWAAFHPDTEVYGR